MDKVRQREIASQGGKAAHKAGTAHEWDHEAAIEAGRKGGLRSHQLRRERYLAVKTAAAAAASE